jgi:hypothetical protein
MACRRKNTGTSSNGFVCANKGGGTSRWMPTPWRASSISFLTKLKVNRRGACFASGRLTSEISRHDELPKLVAQLLSYPSCPLRVF